MKTRTALPALILAAAVSLPGTVAAAPDQRPEAATSNDGRDARQHVQSQPAENPQPRQPEARRQQHQRRKIDADRGRQYRLTPHVRRYYASTRS